MLKINRLSSPTREEVIEFVRSLPSDMVCTNRLIEFEPTWISIEPLDNPIDVSAMRPSRVTLTFERDLMHSDKQTAEKSTNMLTT